MPSPQQASRVVCLLALCAFIVQFPAQARAAGKGDVFFGYSRTGSDIFYPSTPGLNGWDLDGQVHWKPFIGIDGDVAHYGIGADSSVPRTTTVLFGPKVSVGPAAIKVFGHFLVGGEHSANSSAVTPISGGAFAYAYGAGADVPIAPFFGWRVQVDHLSAPTQSPAEGTHVRFTTGIVLRF
ncbi:MAG: hypothetical protein ABSD59_11975 [Terracidiphilus sp.]|jgi:hypothetical protein